MIGPADLVVVDRAARQADGAVRRRQSEEHPGQQRAAARRTPTGGWIAELARAGVEVVNISPIREDGPECRRPEWIPIRPEHRHRDAARADPHAGGEGLHDQAFLARYLHRLRARAALPDGRERRPAEGRRMGGGDHRRAGRHDPRAGAAHGGDAHHGDGVVVAAARRITASSPTGR